MIEGSVWTTHKFYSISSVAENQNTKYNVTIKFLSTTHHFDILSKPFNVHVRCMMMKWAANDRSQWQSVLWPTKVHHFLGNFDYNIVININRNILLHPTTQNSFITTGILLVLPHGIFSTFSIFILGYSKENLQFQGESAEEVMRGHLQPSRASCLSQSQVAQNELSIKTPTLWWK